MSSLAFIRLLALTFFQSYHNIRFNLFRCYSFLCQLFQIFMLLFFRFSHFHVSRYLAFQVLYFFNIYVLMLMGFKFLDSPIIRFMVFSSRICQGFRTYASRVLWLLVVSNFSIIHYFVQKQVNETKIFRVTSINSL